MNKKLLSERYKQFKNIPFPPAPKEDWELEDIFCELNLFDSYIAGAIEKILAKKKINYLELIYEKKLEDKIKAFINREDNKNKRLAQSYLNYMEEIKRVIEDIRNFIHGN